MFSNCGPWTFVGMGVACKVTTCFLVIITLYSTFSSMLTFALVVKKKAMMNETAGIIAQIKAAASNYNSNHFLFTAILLQSKHYQIFLKYVLHEGRIITLINLKSWLLNANLFHILMKKWELCIKHFYHSSNWWLSKGKALVLLCEFLDEGWRQVSLCSSLRIPLYSHKFSLFYIYSIQILLLSLRLLVYTHNSCDHLS